MASYYNPKGKPDAFDGFAVVGASFVTYLLELPILILTARWVDAAIRDLFGIEDPKYELVSRCRAR